MLRAISSFRAARCSAPPLQRHEAASARTHLLSARPSRAAPRPALDSGRSLTLPSGRRGSQLEVVLDDFTRQDPGRLGLTVLASADSPAPPLHHALFGHAHLRSLPRSRRVERDIGLRVIQYRSPRLRLCTSHWPCLRLGRAGASRRSERRPAARKPLRDRGSICVLPIRTVDQESYHCPPEEGSKGLAMAQVLSGGDIQLCRVRRGKVFRVTSSAPARVSPPKDCEPRSRAFFSRLLRSRSRAAASRARNPVRVGGSVELRGPARWSWSRVSSTSCSRDPRRRAQELAGGVDIVTAPSRHEDVDVGSRRAGRLTR